MADPASQLRGRISWRRQLGAVLRKNWILTKRNPKDLIREVGVPIMLLVVIVVMRNSFSATTTAAVPHYPTYSLPSLESAATGPVYFAPCSYQNDTDPVYNFMATFTKRTGVPGKCFQCNVPSGACTGSASMQSTALQDINGFTGGIVFDEPSSLTGAAPNSKPASVAYTIRLNSETLSGVGNSNLTSTTQYGPDGTSAEYLSLFLPLQLAVEETIAVVTTNSNTTMEFLTREFPFPAYTVDIGTEVLANLIPIYFVLIFSLQVRVLVQRILEEKQKRIKEGMKMMGLSDVVFFLGWMVTAAMKGGVVVVAMTLVCKFGGIFTNSNVLLVLIWFLAFLLVCIAYTFVLTTFFDNARTGGVVGMLLYLALFLPSLVVRKPSVPRALQLVCSLLPPTAFSLGNDILNAAEGSGVGLQFSNLFQDSSFGISMGECLVMVLVDVVIFSIMAWYFDRVIPSEYGTHSEPLFCCRRRYWCRGSESRLISSPLLEVEGDATAIEPVSEQLEEDRAVVISGLCKTFNTKEGPKKAVDHLNLSMYKNQITCLLGHNGAGKTTTISMLTGLIPSTAGDATVFNRSIVDDIQACRELTGVCPQYDILFDKLTVMEHLELFGGLKGISSAALETQVKEMVNDLGLGEKMHALASTLSGGQKRRLSVAIALMGDPKVVFLDEPTSGLDPAARRNVWGVLERFKKGRVIVLCTHFMEEADILGDRIAVMAHGSLRVVGSSLYLKNRFGLGYHLSVSLREAANDAAVLDLVRNHVPLARQEEDLAEGAIQRSAEANRGMEESKLDAADSKVEGNDADDTLYREISFVLPMTSAPRFAGLFKQLERDQDALGVQNYGLSMTTLEEVFLRLAEVVEQEKVQQDAERAKSKDGVDSSAPQRRSMDLRTLGAARGPVGSTRSVGAQDVAVAVPNSSNAASGYAKLGTPASTAFDTFKELDQSTYRHMKATLWRLSRAARRDKRGLFLQMILPCVFVALSSVFRSIAATTPATSLTSLSMTPNQWTPLAGDDPTFPFAVASPDLASSLLPYFPKATGGMPPLKRVSGSPMTADQLDTYLLAHEYQVGALYFGDGSIQLDYNTSVVNFLPIALNLVNNALLQHTRALHGFADNANPVSVSYDPFPLTASQRTVGIGEFISGGLIGFYIALGFSAIPGLIALRVVKEKEVKAKQQQFVMGMKPASYYLGNLAWDSLQFVVPWLFSCIIFYFLGTDAMRIQGNFFMLVIVLLMSGVANAAFVYAFSFLFTSHTSAQTFTMLFQYLGTTVTFFIAFVLAYPSVSVPNVVVQILDYLFLLFPNFVLAKSFMDVNIKASCFAFGGPGPLCTPPSAFSWDIGGQKIAFLAASIVVWLAITLVLEHALAPKPPSSSAAPYNMQEGAEYEDDDVRKERSRVDAGDANGDNVVVRHLRKVFPGRAGNAAKVAVADFTIGARAGECFGLLGPNGAGKTTALSMLTADLSPSFGSATVHGKDIFAHRDEVYSMMGYCPQFDALFDLLTGEECLAFYARVKGIPEEDVQAFVDRSITRMDLTRYRNEITKNYSGGNKRKLSLSVAFVGAPRTVFLDEPSTGMDPVARRHMWNVVSSSRAGRTIFLTTHLLEEADVLASRIGILVNGRLACLGTPQRLKSLYGAGYRMEIKTSNPVHERALDELVATFAPDMQVVERHMGHVNYELGRTVSLARIFEAMEGARDQLEIQDYAVSQTSLEQVFLSFAKRQAENFDL